MAHEHNIQLETRRLVLKPFTKGDADNMYQLNSDEEVLRFTGDGAFDSVSAATEFLDQYIPQQRHGYGRMSVTLKQTGEFIGWCGFKEHDEYTDLGFRFFKMHWGQGYATEAAQASLEYGFSTLKLSEVVGRVATDNTASIIVLKKLGFKFWKNAPCDGIQDAQYFKLNQSTYCRLTSLTEKLTDTLNEKEKNELRILWNQQYPKVLNHGTMESFAQYLNSLKEPQHLLLKHKEQIIGWFFTFIREGGTWFGMILNEDWQNLGLGAKMLRWAKKNYHSLNGWAVDTGLYDKANDNPYPSPLKFYEKQGFNIKYQERFATDSLSTVKVEWSTEHFKE